jgi:hypothetical protein
MAHVRKGRAVSPKPPGSSVSSGLFGDPIGHWILRFLQTVARRGEPGGFRSRRVNAPAYSRSPSVLSALGVLLLLSPAVRADEISLRDGSSLTGRVLMVQSGGYVFQDNAPRGTMQNIPKAAVRYVLYDDPAQADHILGIRARYAMPMGMPALSACSHPPFGWPSSKPFKTRTPPFGSAPTIFPAAPQAL